MKDYKNNSQALFDDLGKAESTELECALMHLYEALYHKVCHHVAKNSGDEADARSILSSGLEDLYHKRRQGKLKNENLYGMLMKICQYKWLNKLNKKKTLSLVLDVDESPLKRKLAAMEYSDDEALERESLFTCVHQKLQKLKKAKREIVMDKYFGNLSLKELAERYGTTANHVKNILFRTRHELRALILDCPGFSI